MSDRVRPRRDPERRAADLLLEHHDAKTVPVDVAKIAEQCEAEIRYADFDEDLSGMLIRDGQRKVIAVAASHPLVRQRYTIAHELGHLVMHPGRPYIAESAHIVRIDRRLSTPGLANPREEREANQFAAALLMPVELTTRYLGRERGAVTPQVIKTMAAVFKVSSIAMQYRLINLGLYIPDATDDE